MSKLYFRYGTMGAGKSADLIRCFYSYKQKDLSILCYKSCLDNRDSSTEIVSRTGGRIDAIPIDINENIFDNFQQLYENNFIPHIILIDEAQFLTKNQIDQLYSIIMEYNISIICYGLKTNFQSNLFEGSKRLLEIADDIAEIKSICWCQKKATQNARIFNDKMIQEGDLIQMGSDDTYLPLCMHHYFKKQIHNKIF